MNSLGAGLNSVSVFCLLLLRDIAESESAFAIHVTVVWSVRLSVCLYVCISSVTHIHSAKAVGRNKIPVGRDTRVAPSSIVLDRGSGPPVEIWGLEPPVKNPQFAMMPPIARLLRPLLLLFSSSSSASLFIPFSDELHCIWC